ncbi:helix-turn-helix domain-containing protein [Epidermidibacterium keratini]|uniref:Helix-turn-helix domain-containing protein n=1 Tax=Epidermidibacterium keratini TaxID=1891644 RepID=A0A7L4YSW7_9ACTN|nr:helix-turn-helix domain-containing protein [Epidermidibacterium keratini]QHC01869.1 helix-turn-helix domain-containing protein [Epidermidibacterium keratini]
MAQKETVEHRLAELEQRVRRLEAGADPAQGSSALSADEKDAFWALLELGRRSGRPDSAGSVMIVGDVRTPSGHEAKWQLGGDTDDLLASDWAERATVFAALGHPVRLAILQAVVTGSASTAKELADVLDVGSVGQIYHHLKELTAAGWLSAGSGKRYAVPAGRLVSLLTTLLGGTR